MRRTIFLLAVLILMLALTTRAFAQNRTHVVQPGDTLYSIARRYGVTVEQIAVANGITNPERINVGQVLIIPGGGAPGGGPQTYTVQPGDTLYSIARRFNTTVDTLIRLNGLTNPDVLYVGQVLIVSTGGRGTATPTSNPPTSTSTAPPSTLTPTPGGSGQAITHVVKRGETLGQIALIYGTTYQQIALLNNLSNPDLIYPGQVLIIRPAQNQGTATPTQKPTTPATNTATQTPGSTATAAPSPTPATATTVPTRTPTSLPTRTPTTPGTLTPTLTPVSTVTPGGSPPTPTAIPSPTPIAPPTTVPADAPNRFTNPGFEGETRAAEFEEVKVFEGWQPFYCDQPYTTQKCPAERQGAGNPPGLLMARPEYQATELPNRVRSGETAQEWFCFFRACRAGVYQIVNTKPGATCEAGIYVQSWSANGTGLTSDLQTQDQRDNSTWTIKIDLSGGTNAFAPTLLVSRVFGYADGIYDKYARISYTFTATGDQTTLFFENLRLWPIANNDNFVDDAYVRCTE